MSAHTPGPWEWQNGSSWWRLGTRWGDGDVLQPVVASYDRHPDLSFKNPADKPLIECAPEMLAALHKVVAYARIACRSEGMPEGAEPKRLTAQVVGGDEGAFALLDIKEIRALIAKAEGRS